MSVRSSVASELASDRASEVDSELSYEEVKVVPIILQVPQAAPKRRRSNLLKYLFLAFLVCLIPAIVAPAVVYSRKNGPASATNPNFAQLNNIKSRVERADAVKDAFNFAWSGYMAHAFPHDQLLPMNNSFSDPRSAWGSTAVDSLSTAIIMGLPEPVATMLKHVSEIDFTRSVGDISVFETNIRYLGGMLSAYDLLKGPFASVPHDPALRDNLLGQAKKLADLLSMAFATPSGIPDNIIRFNGPKPVLNGSTSANLAEMGSLVLEWTRLSNLVNNQKYANLTQHAQEYLIKPKPQSEPFPGLVGSVLSIADGSFVDQTGGWGGGSDSFYEYLIKSYVYDPVLYKEYKDRWIKAADSSMMYLASHPSSKTDLTFLAGFDGTKGIPESGHLNCFAGGNFLLGGNVLKEQKYIDFGLNLTSSCRQTYQMTQTGIGPEFFSWIPQECASGGFKSNKRATLKTRNHLNFTTQAGPELPDVTHTTFDCSNSSPKPGGIGQKPITSLDMSRAKDKFYQKSGFWIVDPTYNLRPEVLESYYYAYRMTGDSKYQDWAWDAFNAINSYARLNSGFNPLGNVNVEGGDNGKGGGMESYFFAETLKYAFLIFGEDGEHQVNYKGGNRFVFNTEGHPLRVATA